MGNSELIQYLKVLDPIYFQKNREIDAQLRFVLTQSCNEQCFFCHNEGLPVKNNFMQFDFFKKIIKVVKENQYPHKVRFTGGEPMLHKGLFDFIAHTKEQLPNNSVGITTNGLLIKRYIEKIIHSGLDSITVSIHSLSPEKYKKITKVDGLGTVLSGLQLLNQKGFAGQVKINSVIDEKNIDELNDFYEFSKINGFELKILDILTDTYKGSYRHSSDHIGINDIRKRAGELVGGQVKKDRTQPKCNDCLHFSTCGHEASYLRITPSEILNPCLSLDKHNINLSNLSEEYFEKSFFLGLRRVKSLDI